MAKPGIRICAAAAIGTMLLCGALGCRLNRKYPSQPVRIVGMSYNPGAAFQLVPPPEKEGEWQFVDTTISGNVMVSADAAIPADSLDPLRGKLIARQEAKQNARRKLAERVEATEVHTGLTIGDVIEKDAAKREKVEDYIRTAQQKGVIKAEGGKCTVFLTLDLVPLNRILAEGSTVAVDYSASATATALTPEEYRKHAYEEAVENARARMLEYLKGLRLPENETLGELMVKDDAVDRAIRERVDMIIPAARFNEDNNCEAALILDLAEVQQILDEHKSLWQRLW